MADENYANLAATTADRRSGLRARAVIGTALLAFLLGGGAVGYAVWQGYVPLHRGVPEAAPAPVGRAQPAPAAAAAATANLVGQQDALEARVAALAQRLDTLDALAEAASGKAARAEALLVAFAARRALDQGAQLGMLEDQLRLRFADAQPHAVATVIDAARQPVTLGQLVGGLDALAPDLVTAPASTGAWTRFKQELAGLFVIRRQSAPSPEPQVILRRARVLLEEGRTDDATREVRRLPGAGGANTWFAAAQRYADARRALDVLETTALIEPQGLPNARPVRTSTPPPAAPTPDLSEAAAAPN